jgi:hypothetical protein
LRGIYSEIFFLALFWVGAPDRAVETIRKGGIVHGASLVQFLIIGNYLSS